MRPIKLKVSCVLFLLITIMIVGCSAKRNKIVVKGDDTLRGSIEESPVSSNTNREVLSRNSPEFFEDLDNTVRYANLVRTIAAACSGYRAAYGALPQKLDDVLDGFLLIWPVSPYTGKPFGIINTMPDPDNPNHIGKVYYERIDDSKGYLYTLNIDMDNYEEDKQEYMIEEVEIVRRGDLYPTAPHSKLPPEDCAWWAFNHSADSVLRTRFNGSIIANDGSLPSDFAQMLTDNGYEQFMIVKEGLNKLREGIHSGMCTFEIGEVNYGEYYYVDANHFCRENSIMTMCRVRICLVIGSGWDDRTQKELTYVLPASLEKGADESAFDEESGCPKDANYTAVLFSSNDFENYEIPAKVIITKDEVLGY